MGLRSAPSGHWEEGLGPRKKQLSGKEIPPPHITSQWFRVKFQGLCQLNSLLTLELVTLQESKAGRSGAGPRLAFSELGSSPVKWEKPTHQQTLSKAMQPPWEGGWCLPILQMR